MSSWNTVVKSRKSAVGKYKTLALFTEEIIRKFQAYSVDYNYSDKIIVSVREEEVGI